jgi:S1-C subfamily serine protease
LTLPFFPGIKRLMTSGFYTQVFSAMGAESSLSLPQPSAGIVNLRAVRKDEASIVKVQGVAPTCSLKIEGSGFVISPHYVLTNAHVVAGVTDGPTIASAHGPLPATVVLYDPQRDVAILHVPALTAPPLKWATSPAPYGADAVVVGYPLNQGLTPVPARVGHSISAYGPDIYQNHNVNRKIYPIESTVKPGNSGGPLLATDGRVYGVVFAASIQDPSVGYALTAGEVHSDVTQGEHLTAPRSTQTCQQGG